MTLYPFHLLLPTIFFLLPFLTDLFLGFTSRPLILLSVKAVSLVVESASLHPNFLSL